MLEKIKEKINKGKKGIAKAMENIVYHAKGDIDTLFDFQTMSKSNVLELVNMVEMKKAIDEAREDTEELKSLRKWSKVKMMLALFTSLSLTYFFTEKIRYWIVILISHELISTYIITSFVAVALCNVFDVEAINGIFRAMADRLKPKEEEKYFKEEQERKSLLLAIVSSFGMNKDKVSMTAKEMVKKINKERKADFTEKELTNFMRANSMEPDKSGKYNLNNKKS